MTDKTRAYLMAREAAMLDFEAAIQGLLSGHAEAIEGLRDSLTKKDAALLASLALSRKGARMGADDGLASVIRDGLCRDDSAPVVRDFIDRHDSTEETDT